MLGNSFQRPEMPAGATEADSGYERSVFSTIAERSLASFISQSGISGQVGVELRVRREGAVRLTVVRVHNRQW